MKLTEASLQVSHNSFEDRHKLCQGAVVPPVAAEMRTIVMEAAWPPVPGEGVGAVVQRASRRLSLSYARVRAYYYGLVRLVPAEEADRLRAIQRDLLTERLRRMDSEAAIIRARLEGTL